MKFVEMHLFLKQQFHENHTHTLIFKVYVSQYKRAAFTDVKAALLQYDKLILNYVDSKVVKSKSIYGNAITYFLIFVCVKM